MTDSVELFVEIVKSYCSLIEQHNDYSREEFVTRISKVLPLLYYRAMALPEVQVTDEDVDREISHEEWSAMFASLQRKLGANDLYWEIYDPLKMEPDEPVASSLSDDLADIWRDLKNGLMQWCDCPLNQRQEIIWQWHFSFHTHWAYHLVDAMRPINWILESYGIRDF